jgi:UDP-N-acetylglucosamine 4,6-dehydratase
MMHKKITGQKVLITGGAGSLGKALTSRLVEQGNQVTVYSRDEGKHALAFAGTEVQRIIGDVRDFDKMNVSVKRANPDLIIHAAALKRIDDMEMSPDECVKTNIQGSENVAKAALLNDVPRAMLVSTDKACQPVNVYGSSKFIAERIFTNFDYHSDSTIFSSVRYGNVIASRGSFIPLWLSLLQEGQKIKVTSMEMTRFLFTLGDAVDTVLDATQASEGGEVFIPKISSYGMNTILQSVEALHGAPIEYDIIGLRPGEKLHEDMLAKTELPFSYDVDGTNLICVRPQYSKRERAQDWKKYKGTEFNSALHTSSDVETLVKLVHRGTSEEGVI